MKIELSLHIDGETTTLNKTNFQGSFVELLTLFEKACTTHDYNLSEFIGAYAAKIQKFTDRVEEQEEHSESSVIAVQTDHSIN